MTLDLVNLESRSIKILNLESKFLHGHLSLISVPIRMRMKIRLPDRMHCNTFTCDRDF